MTVVPKRQFGQHFLVDPNILDVVGRLARLDVHAEARGEERDALAAQIHANAARAFSLP